MEALKGEFVHFAQDERGFNPESWRGLAETIFKGNNERKRKREIEMERNSLKIEYMLGNINYKQNWKKKRKRRVDILSWNAQNICSLYITIISVQC